MPPVTAAVCSMNADPDATRCPRSVETHRHRTAYENRRVTRWLLPSAGRARAAASPSAVKRHCARAHAAAARDAILYQLAQRAAPGPQPWWTQHTAHSMGAHPLRGEVLIHLCAHVQRAVALGVLRRHELAKSAGAP